mmetsp:Transcript_34491/g.42521  ORF Transcript_34491/g.42521 Transcript_34491/m.42521 type:complete len:365 (+) Transcript_34491:162-1256(+)|eukprot:CAMPEP_0204825338 /NCGR_PEP_ID=MMETSP1346-20131115/3246_1 /ASSEMBLY_ACC=CAM_ASM_000771 /TAXON_ID=215587 /ORGANISM="Aplanochytrium stocchinoi, Strain GSBS06" /LENGTH=364 /DNA_ID=CAMNT_0051952935 /DNA_START=113 /DNA_END=1207 /DNA_ORIENTATION=+
MAGFLVEASAHLCLLVGAALTSNIPYESRPGAKITDALEEQRLAEAFGGGVFTAENFCKPLYIFKGPYEYDFTPCDVELDFAQRNNMAAFRFHTLFWDTPQVPAWMKNRNHPSVQNVLKTQADWEDVTKDMINKTIFHYQDRVQYYDVVNEIILAKYHSNLVIKQYLQNQYLATLFSWAKESVNKLPEDIKKPLLGINEWGVGLSVNSWRDRTYYNLVKRLVDQNLVDYIGFQMHLSSRHVTPSGLQNMRRSLEKFNNLGVEIHFTEIDIQLGGNQQALANAYKNVFRICLSISNCKVVQTWGVSDKYSWKSRDFAEGRFANVLLYKGGPDREKKLAATELTQFLKDYRGNGKCCSQNLDGSVY